MSPPSVPKIAIIGAGPAGLLLGNLLQVNSIPFQIYEGASELRQGGGSLDLHPQHGQAAMRAAGLWEDFAARSRPESDVMKVVNPAGEILWDGNTIDALEVTEENKFDHRPEIDRGVLMQVLVDRLRPEAIQWSRKLARVEIVPSTDSVSSTSYTLVFANGNTEPGFDLVVGADGAWSKVRKLLTPETPTYAGVTGVAFNLSDAANTNPWAHEMAGAGSCFSFGENQAVMSQRQGSGAIWTYAWLRVPENWAAEGAQREAGIDWSRPKEMGPKLIDTYFADYAPDMVRLLRESEPEDPRPLYHLPVGFHWDHAEGTEGITLLGDAAHVMTPFAGVGVNAALADAFELGKSILAFAGKENSNAQDKQEVEERPKSLADVVAQYEKDMFPRGAAFAAKTAKGLKWHFDAQGSEELAGRLIAHYGRGFDRK